MKKRLTYACTLLLGLLLAASCTDDLVGGGYSGNGVLLRITADMQGSSSATTKVSGDNQYDNHTDNNTELQRYIAAGDIYVLVFENTGTTDNPMWSLYAVPTVSLAGDNGAETRELDCELSKPTTEKTIIVDVMANLAENGLFESASAARSALVNMIGSTREAVYASLDPFKYPEADENDNPYGVWNLEESGDSPYLPMWGQSSDSSNELQSYSLSSGVTQINVTCNLYRSVAKMGVTIDSDCDTFELKEIYVYYINNEGTFVSLPVEGTNWNAATTIQYTQPEVPSSTTQRTIENPLVYKMATALGAGGSYINHIYLTEADNTNADNPVVVVVGGYYLGGDYNGEGLVDKDAADYALNYYRIDLESLSTSTSGNQGVYNLVRNHSYLFNILAANNPGTSDPDPRRAASGLDVEIEDYTDVPMHGINAQYTLTVNQSLFAFEGVTTTVGELVINTDGTGWELVTDDLPEWLHVTDASEHTNVDDVVTIEPDANITNDGLRNASFYIKCGKVMKKINVVQDYTETGNTMLVTQAGTYDMKIDIRGNGVTTAWTNEDGSSKEDIDFGLGADIEDVAYVDIIWETADGFVTIDDKYAISESGSISYNVNNVSLDQFGDWTGYVFDPGNGANALLGVFSEDGELLWTYHIWACGDYAASGVLTETWLVGRTGGSTYTFMDRNLGAYSNLPGSKSFGLLYQWGRKDPFIGAYRENNEQDYHTVRKQYTRHYTINGTTYLWEDFDDAEYGSNATEEARLEKYLIQHPTSLMQYGLLSSIHNNDEAHGLWGTTSYGYDTSETGNKTMYDPCPAGYRVPSLNALTIYDGGHNDLWASSSGNGMTQVEHSSYTARYVPIKEGDSYRTQSDFTADFISDAPFYGFWFDYAMNYGFESSYTTNGATGYGVNYYYENATDAQKLACGWIYPYTSSNPGKPDNVTWLPIAGIYNGSIDHFGRVGLTDRMGNGSEPYLPVSSLQTSSVLWANSPTQTNTNYPAGLLLHGTEGAYAPHHEGTTYQYAAGTVTAGVGIGSDVSTDGEGYWTTSTTGTSGDAVGWWTGSVDYNSGTMYSGVTQGTWNSGTDDFTTASWSDENGLAGGGRHFHSYADTAPSTLANPAYAASVRCIRDKDALVHVDDKVLDGNGDEVNAVTLYQYDSTSGESVQDVIELSVSYVEEFEVTSPGAKWVSVSPSSASTTNASGDTETIKITYNEAYLPSNPPATATITIKFARGTTWTITVTYEGGTRQ